MVIRVSFLLSFGVISNPGCGGPVVSTDGTDPFVLEFLDESDALPTGIRLTFRNTGTEAERFLEPIPITVGPWPTYTTPVKGAHSGLVLRFADSEGNTSEHAAVWTAELPQGATRETLPGSNVHEIAPGAAWSAAVPLDVFRFWGSCGAAADVRSLIEPGETEILVTAVLVDSSGAERESNPRMLRCKPPGFLGLGKSGDDHQVEAADEIMQLASEIPDAKDLMSVQEAIRELDGREFHIRQTAFVSLFGWGPEATDAVPALRHVLKGGNSAERLMATYVLGAIGPPAKEAIVDLKTVTLDPNRRVREVAERSVSLISGLPLPQRKE